MEKPCNIALLRPGGTGWLDFSAEESKDLDDSTTYYQACYDEWLEEYRERLAEVANAVEVPIAVEERQLFLDNGTPGKHFRNTLDDFDVITTLDPSQKMKGMIAGYMHNSPGHRVVLAFSSQEELENEYQNLGAMKTPCFRLIVEELREGIIYVGETRQLEQCNLPRCFGFYYKDEKNMNTALQRALLFHQGKPIPENNN